jgi:uncharacterized protein (UPF0332 family)
VDSTQQSRRWQVAQENQAAAQQSLLQGFYGTSVSRSYYACFQAMWVALGDPPLGRWEHGGVMRTFCRGQWADPVLLPTSLAPLYKKLLALYDLRLDADYRALPVTPEKAQEGVHTVAELFQVVTQHKALDKGNLI